MIVIFFRCPEFFLKPHTQNSRCHSKHGAFFSSFIDFKSKILKQCPNIKSLIQLLANSHGIVSSNFNQFAWCAKFRSISLIDISGFDWVHCYHVKTNVSTYDICWILVKLTRICVTGWIAMNKSIRMIASAFCALI